MYTPSQLKAIETPTKDILVSAGAGSGKTTVLTKRIIEKLISGYSLKDFLIVTFTKASAADLRKKLGRRLEELCIEHPEEARYRNLLYALPSADIGTIDSFCLQYVKQNAASLGLYKGVSVGDEALCDALLTAAADELISELCEADDEEIDLLLDNFAGFKNDNGLISALRSLYISLRKYPFYLSWLDGVLKAHAEETETLKTEGFFACRNGKQVRAMIEKKLVSAKVQLKAMEAFCDTDTEAAFLTDAETAFAPVEDGFDKSYAAYCEAANNYKIRSRPSKTGEEYTAAYNAFKAIMDSRKNLVRRAEDLEAEYDYTGKVLSALCYIIKKLDAAYSAAKAERGIIDFADAEQLFLSLLLQNTEDGAVKTPLCRSISASYKEVFIDEYQDVSPLQDAIFTAIGKGKRFMVGDLKQSIYGFREAYPDIFMNYRDTFAPVEKDADNAVIYLTENFRCDEQVINFCNYLFSKTFTKESADTDYTKEKLKRGKNESGNEPVHLTVIENADAETEFDYTAEQIVKCIYEGFSPSDIAVIARETAAIQSALKALEKRGVPCATEKTAEDLLKQPEVLLALSLLKVIDNPNDDLSLAALLRSPIFRFTADELVKIRSFKEGGNSFYGNIIAASKGKTPLGEKCLGFLKKLSLYRTKALIMPVHSLMWYLYEDSHLLAYAPEGREKRYKDNLFMLYEMARNMESGAYKGVSVFVDYINRLEGDGRSPKAATAAADNAVSLMTMHGSKGLEFPVVFVIGTSAKIKKLHHKDSLSVNYRTGISVKLTKQKEGWRASTVLRNAAIAEQDGRNIAEEHRLLYVAFTRAERRLYINTAIETSLDKYSEKQSGEPSIQADLFLPCLTEGSDDSYTLEVVNGEEEIPMTVLAAAMARGTAAPPLPPIKDTPREPKRTIAKYAVSQVKRLENGALGTDTASLVESRKPLFAGGGDSYGVLKGTATHAFMQFADYKAAEKDVNTEADRLLARGFISLEDRKLLDIAALEGFFLSPLYAEIKAAKRVYREKRFTTELPSALFGAEGETVLVQGVIDCFYENADGTYTLVDYKTDAVRHGEESTLTERYGTQLYLYSLYIEKLTGKKVNRAYLYSLPLCKAIPCETEKYGV